MTDETAMAAAMKKAGVDTDGAELYLAATRCIEAHGAGDAGFYVFLTEIRPWARRLFDQAATDMGREMPAGGGQILADTHSSCAPAAPATERDGEGQGAFDDQNTPAPPSRPPSDGDTGLTIGGAHPQPAPPSEPDPETEGHFARDAHESSAPASPAPDRERETQYPPDTHVTGGLPPREPRRQPQRTPKAVATAFAHLGWIGTSNVPGGPKYVDLRARDLDGMIERQLNEGGTHARAAVALKMIKAEVDKAGVVPPDAKWVDVIPAATVRKISAGTEPAVLKAMAVGWLRGFSQSALNAIQEGANAE